PLVIGWATHRARTAAFWPTADSPFSSASWQLFHFLCSRILTGGLGRGGTRTCAKCFYYIAPSRSCIGAIPLAQRCSNATVLHDLALHRRAVCATRLFWR